MYFLEKILFDYLSCRTPRVFNFVYLQLHSIIFPYSNYNITALQCSLFQGLLVGNPPRNV